MVKYIGYCCVNISWTKNVLEHVHLEEEFVQNQLLITGQLDFLLIHSCSVTCICLLKLSVDPLQWGCIEQLFSALKVIG